MSISIVEIDSVKALDDMLKSLGTDYFNHYKIEEDNISIYATESETYSKLVFPKLEADANFSPVTDEKRNINISIPILTNSDGSKTLSLTPNVSISSIGGGMHFVRGVIGNNSVTFVMDYASPPLSTYGAYITLSKTDYEKIAIFISFPCSSGSGSVYGFSYPMIFDGMFNIENHSSYITPVAQPLVIVSSDHFNNIGLINAIIPDTNDYATGIYFLVYASGTVLNSNKYGSILTLNGEEYYVLARSTSTILSSYYSIALFN